MLRTMCLFICVNVNRSNLKVGSALIGGLDQLTSRGEALSKGGYVHIHISI